MSGAAEAWSYLRSVGIKTKKDRDDYLRKNHPDRRPECTEAVALVNSAWDAAKGHQICEEQGTAICGITFYESLSADQAACLRDWVARVFASLHTTT
jgi:hypothetical protein